MRVSSAQIHQDFSHFNRLRNAEIRQNQLRMNNQRRYQSIGEAPLASAHSTYNTSRIQRYQKYEQNSSYAVGRYQLAESRLAQVIDNVQGMRQLAVQAANGVNTAADLGQMGRMVNELLEDTLALANSRDEQGHLFFGGNVLEGTAFAGRRGYSPILNQQMLTTVEYRGDAGERQIEVEDDVYLPVNFVGNRLFWAGQSELVGGLPSDNFRVLAPSQFFVDGQAVELEVGDGIATVVRKINDLGLGVRARQDPITQVLILTTTVPHQLQLEQPRGGEVLQQLGLLAAGNDRLQAGSQHADALLRGPSLFEGLIGLRDAMFAGDSSAIGSRHLGQLDQALSSLVSGRTALGARQQRLQQQQQYSDRALIDYQRLESDENDADSAELIGELQRTMVAQQAVYQSIARLSSLNLMNHLRL